MVRHYTKIPRKMDVKLEWSDGLKFSATSGSKHQFVIDASSEHGGSDSGPRPMEVLLSSLGSCMGMDLATILKKKKRNLGKLKINLHGERSPVHPHVFTKISIEHLIWSDDITDADVQFALDLSLSKYCSVAAMLNKNCKINFKWRIYKAGSKDK